MSEEKSIQRKFRHKVNRSAAIVGIVMGLIFFIAVFKAGFAAAAQGAAISLADASIVRWAFLSASICVGLSTIAAGIAVAYVGAAALGAISEKPELVGRTLIFVGLAEGLAIYGLIIAIMILAKVG